MQFLRQTIQCHCGKVKIRIDSPDVLRLVCYCKDCRGYYNTLNELSAADKKDPSAKLDYWGGADYTHLYPSELSVLQGKDSLAVGRIREGSKINRVYCTSCYTPMFSVGPSKTVLLNTHLVDDENKANVRFRIIGRDAVKNKETTEPRPQISWSVPISWFWTMPRRMNKAKTTPMPIEIPEDGSIFKNFKQG